MCFIFLWPWNNHAVLNLSVTFAIIFLFGASSNCWSHTICQTHKKEKSKKKRAQRTETRFPHVQGGRLKTVDGLNVKAFQGLWARTEGKFKGNHLSCLCQVVSRSSWPGSCLNRPTDLLPSWSLGPWTGCPTSPWASCSHSYRWAAWSKRTHVHSVLSSEDPQLWWEQTLYHFPRASLRLAAVCFWRCLLCLIQWHTAAFLFILPMIHAKLFSIS